MNTLGQRKVDHSEYENFKDFYTSDWQKFMEYNIQDVELIDRLEDKMKLLELAITMAYDAKVNFEDVERSGLKALAENQKLSYELQDGRDGRVMATELQSL